MARKSNSQPFITAEYLQGIHLSDSILWFDAPRRADLCFISHAHLGLSIAHKKILATPETAALVREKVAPARALLSPFHRRFIIGDLELELFPAGHIPGSAQIRVSRTGERLVYTGHFNLHSGRAVENASVLECEVLVAPVVYARPHHVFPPRLEVEAAVLEFVKRALTDEVTPVLLASPLGNALELAILFAEQGLKVRAHRAIVFSGLRARKLGLPLPKIKRFDGRVDAGEVLMLPPWADREVIKTQLVNARLALVSGRTLEPGYTESLGAIQGFPLSSHADRNSIIRYIQESGARRIFLIGSDADLLANELRAKRIAVWPLLSPQQLDLFRR